MRRLSIDELNQVAAGSQELMMTLAGSCGIVGCIMGGASRYFTGKESTMYVGGAVGFLGGSIVGAILGVIAINLTYVENHHK